MLPALLLGGVLSAALWLHGLGDGGLQVPFSVGLLAAAVASAAVRIARRSGGVGRDRLWIIPLAGIVALVACQAANPSHGFLVDSRALFPIAHLPFLPSSVDRSTTTQALLLLVGYASAFWLAREFLVDFRSRVAFASVQVACGACMALLVIAQRNVPPDGALYAATGTFVSPNHYVAYANLVWPPALLWGWELHRRARQRGTWIHGGYLLSGAAVILLISVFRCDSRMGMAVSLMLMAGVAAGELWAMSRHRRLVCWVAVGALTILIVVGGLWAMSSLPAAAEFRGATNRLPGDMASRLPVWRAALAMWADRWVAGTGAGTFELAFPYYQPHFVPGFYRHAHNELLQIMAELGVVGTVLLGWMMYGMISTGRTCGAPAQDWTARERRGITLALCGLALHAMVDFPLRLPALVLLAAAWVGMGGRNEMPKESTS
jgi:O-antigen ligase